ncbi:MAG: TIGR02217 family protein [Beijerinckiaceae bacterium]
MAAFHEIQFPLDIALGSRGGPERMTDVVTLGSGREERNQRWFHSRRRYNAGYGVKTLAAISQVTAFFEERRGKLYGFRWRDAADFKSCDPAATPGPLDQNLGSGDGSQSVWQLRKMYGSGFAPYYREIRKPVSDTVRVAISGVEVSAAGFSCNFSTGELTMAVPPPSGAEVTAGFLFDVPVRFDTDFLDIDIAAFGAGEIPHLPIVEILTQE